MADPVEPAVPGWPEAADRKLIGQRIARLDGPAKASGHAKYTYDLKPQGMLWARMLRCPHAHARIKSLDVAAAQAMPGVKAVFVIQKVGAEIQWALDEVAAVAATSEAQAADAVKAIKIEYEVLPHFVTEEKLAGAPKVDPGEVMQIVLMSLGLSFAATLYPSWRAARTDPVEALRYE